MLNVVRARLEVALAKELAGLGPHKKGAAQSQPRVMPPIERINGCRQTTHLFSTADGLTLHLIQIAAAAGQADAPVMWVSGTGLSWKTWDLNDDASVALKAAQAGIISYLFSTRGVEPNQAALLTHPATIETEIKYDLPAALRFAQAHSKKPVTLAGYSKGGVVILYFLVYHCFKLQQLLGRDFLLKGKTRKEIGEYIASLPPNSDLAQAAQRHLEILNSVNGLILLGAPLVFEKGLSDLASLPAAALLAWQSLGGENVPVQLAQKLVRLFPFLANAGRLAINPENFADPQAFLAEFCTKCLGSVPTIVARQAFHDVLKGRGTHPIPDYLFDFGSNLDLIPLDIPVFMFCGRKDLIAPLFNLGLIDPAYARESSIELSLLKRFPHKEQVVHSIASEKDVAQIRLSSNRSSVTGFAIEGVNHLDLFFGRVGRTAVRPLLYQIIKHLANPSASAP
jgi:pimeloyl-ACP methyl ester carboxylesterase